MLVLGLVMLTLRCWVQVSKSFSRVLLVGFIPGFWGASGLQNWGFGV